MDFCREYTALLKSIAGTGICKGPNGKGMRESLECLRNWGKSKVAGISEGGAKWIRWVQLASQEQAKASRYSEQKLKCTEPSLFSARLDQVECPDQIWLQGRAKGFWHGGSHSAMPRNSKPCSTQKANPRHTIFHPSTNHAHPCLASEMRQDRAHSGWYGCRQEHLSPLSPVSFFLSVAKYASQRHL